MSWWRRKDKNEHQQDAVPEQPFDPVIRLENVSRIFKGDTDEETHALRSVSIEVRRGEYASIAGPSGCGKSTFLSVLALLDTPSSGRYWLNGKPTDRMSPAERARARSLEIGLIFQSFNLIGDMTVYENVEYPLTLRRTSPSERQAKVKAALERVGLSGRARQRPGSLSGGHQQLVAIARAIAGRPSVLLADEPTGNLDSTSGEALMQMLGELHRDGATVLIATHDPRWIAQAPRKIYMLDGAIADHATV